MNPTQTPSFVHLLAAHPALAVPTLPATTRRVKAQAIDTVAFKTAEADQRAEISEDSSKPVPRIQGCTATSLSPLTSLIATVLRQVYTELAL